MIIRKNTHGHSTLQPNHSVLPKQALIKNRATAHTKKSPRQTYELTSFVSSRYKKQYAGGTVPSFYRFR